MLVDERTSLLHAQCNKANDVKQSDKLIIYVPSEKVFEMENYWCCLSLNELLPFQDDPWWQRLRSALFYTIWLTILLTIITACWMASMHTDISCKAINSNSGTTEIVDLLRASTVRSISMTSDVSGKLAMAP